MRLQDGGLWRACGENEGVELQDVPLVAGPGDQTSCVTLNKLPNLLELQLSPGGVEKLYHEGSVRGRSSGKVNSSFLNCICQSLPDNKYSKKSQ